MQRELEAMLEKTNFNCRECGKQFDEPHAMCVVCDECAARSEEKFQRQQKEQLIKSTFDFGIAYQFLPSNLMKVRSEKAREEKNQDVWNYAREWVGMPMHERENLYLYGPPNTGKTFLATCLLKAMVCAGVKCARISAFEFAKAAVLFAAPERYEVAARVPVLVIDDFDKPRFSDDVLSFFWHLLDMRCERYRTIITSNFSPRDVLQKMTNEVKNGTLPNATMRRIKPIKVFEMT